MRNTVRDTRLQVVAWSLLILGLAATPSALAHTPVVDGFLTDWCVGATSNTAPAGGRTEDSAVELTCGNCSVTTDEACNIDTDCPMGETCVNLNSRTEIAFWDNRTDGAVNDLGTVAMTWDAVNLYISAELWVDPDPGSLPFGQIAIDVVSGGVNLWHDPESKLVNPGRCSVSTDRACTTDADCHFCTVSTEPFPSTRVRTCGSGCDPDDPTDVCDMSETCQNLGSLGLIQAVGADASPASDPDFLILFDFSFWLLGAEDAVLLAKPTATGNPLEWFNILGVNIAGWGATAWDPVVGCAPDFAGDGTECDFAPQVNPGASGGSGGPPGSVEVAIPWTAFGGVMGPDIPFRFTMDISRGTSSLNFSPDGAHEDVLSETVAGSTTTTLDSCPGMGAGTTDCELADGSTDSFIPRMPPLNHEDIPGGRNVGLLATKNGNGMITLDWMGSCSAGDTDYGVYEGTIGTWYDQIPVVGLCSTGGMTTATFNPGGGDHYYLVVPNNGMTEGSYGVDGSGGERPASLAQCEPQSLGNCP